MTSFKSVAGGETRVLLSNKAAGHQLDLMFENVLEAGVKSIMDHWGEAVGSFHSFALPSSVWSGWVQYTAAVPSNQKWRYDAPPKIEAVAPSIMTVSVTLVSVS